MLILSHSGIVAIEGCPFRLILLLNHQGIVRGGYPRNNLHKLNTIPGHAIHLAIERFIDRWKDNPLVTPLVSELSESAISIINNIWENKETQILEYIQNIDIDKEKNYQSEQLRRIQDLCVKFCRIWNDNGYQNMHYISHEKIDSHQFIENYELSGGIDLLIRDDDGIFHVIDWKSGIASRMPLGSSQLGIYAFLTHHIHDVALSDIRCTFVSLKDGSCKPREFRERDMKLLETRIQKMIEIEQGYANGEYSDSEWANPTEQNCLGCSYANNCEFNYFR